MAKANRKVLRDRKGTMGIGTMIIFIATIITAAVAAGVLIMVNQQLREKGLETGEGAIKGFTTLLIMDAYATTKDEYKFAILGYDVGETTDSLLGMAGAEVPPKLASASGMAATVVGKVANAPIPLVGKLLSPLNLFVGPNDDMRNLYIEVKSQEGGSQFFLEDLRIETLRGGHSNVWFGDEVKIVHVIADSDGSIKEGSMSGGDRVVFKLSDMAEKGLKIGPGESMDIKVTGKYGNGDEWKRAALPIYSEENRWSLERV